MTAQAGLYFRNRSICGLGHGPVTILALHFVDLDMANMTEVYGLLWGIASYARVRTKDKKMIQEWQIPESGHAVIPYAARDIADRWIVRIAAAFG